MENNTIVAVSNLNHSYGTGNLSRQVLFNVELEVATGEIIILSGPSGSGKSSLLTLIGGLRSIQAGSIKVFGSELKGASSFAMTELRKRIGFIFQNSALVGFLTAQKNVEMALELNYNSNVSKLAQDILNTVGLSHVAHQYPQQLSLGERQRVAIARAVANSPQLILADEPTASLDSKTGRQSLEFLYKLAKTTGSAVIIVTHDYRILDIADRRMQLEDGQLKDF